MVITNAQTQHMLGFCTKKTMSSNMEASKGRSTITRFLYEGKNQSKPRFTKHKINGKKDGGNLTRKKGADTM